MFYGTETNSFHLWFLIALVWSTLIVSFFVKINKLIPLLIVSFALNVMGLFGQSYHVFFDFPLHTRDALFFGLFYTALGCCFASGKLRLKRNPLLWSGLAILFSILQIAEGLSLIHLLDSHIDNYYLSTIPLSISLIALALTSSGVAENNPLAKIGNKSVGIFVLHPLFISASLLFVSWLNVEAVRQTFIWNISFTPVILVVSYLSYEVLQKAKRRLFTRINARSTAI